ncbi:MAG: ABC transporter ATP-binding protein [Clostridiales bacterium]|nr:ABC transporter ATP-binding protein [Clostridiales bacterium]
MLEVVEVSKKYGNKLAVDRISFTVGSGEVVGFLGTNGAGKSTTMNMITGYLSCSEGKITVDGHDILTDSEKVKKQIGYLPEIPPLYQDLTVWESLCFTYDLKKVKLNKKEHLNEICELVQITDVKNKLVHNLSKGYKQRVGLANALIGNPPLLILDEPTVGLDPKQIIEIRKLIHELAKTRTVILSSHILQEIEAVCDRIIIINQGKIVADDTPIKLIETQQTEKCITLQAQGKPTQIVSLLKTIPNVEDVTYKMTTQQDVYEYYLETKGVDVRATLSFVLVQNHIPLLELRSNQPTLEDVFMKYTTKSYDAYTLDEEEGGEEDVCDL